MPRQYAYIMKIYAHRCGARLPSFELGLGANEQPAIAKQKLKISPSQGTEKRFSRSGQFLAQSVDWACFWLSAITRAGLLHRDTKSHNRAVCAYQPSASLKSSSSDTHGINFCRHRLNRLRVHWSAKHGLGIGKAHSPTPAHPGQRSQETSRPRTARSAVSSSRPPAPALWREDRGLPIGSYINEAGKRRKLGSRISVAAGRAGGNFLTPEIAHTARLKPPTGKSARSNCRAAPRRYQRYPFA
jgi:hypothetical protein